MGQDQTFILTDRSPYIEWNGGSGSYMRREGRIGTDGQSPPGRMAPIPMNTGSS